MLAHQEPPCFFLKTFTLNPKSLVPSSGMSISCTGHRQRMSKFNPSLLLPLRQPELFHLFASHASTRATRRLSSFCVKVQHCGLFFFRLILESQTPFAASLKLKKN
eukprot:s238_g27.t1